MMGKRYYVQRLTEQVFVVRERLSADGEPGRDDHIVRSFAFGEEAYRYANQINERQRDLDEHYGHWAQHAMEPGDLENLS